MIFTFAKYSGCGNDFILVDNRTNSLDFSDKVKIERMCHRRWGIGADGVVVLGNSHSADFSMRIFNADGSEAEMCGNGIRCLARFIAELGFSQPNFSIETMHQKVNVSLTADQVSVVLPPPTDVRYFIPLNLGAGLTRMDETITCAPGELSHTPDAQATVSPILTIHYLNTGVPHAVLFVKDIEDSRHMSVAPHIQRHPDFHPKGTNVDFVEILSDHSIAIRTYERGVEQETLACGTGAVAAALAAGCVHHLTSPIEVRTRSQEALSIAFDQADSPQKILLRGPAVKIYQGEINIP